jgi:predicted PolB exonuclease-like 3'-5' exonuclease
MANYALLDIETRIDWSLLEQVEDCDREEYLAAQRQRLSNAADEVWIPHTFHLPIAIAVGLIEPTTGELTKVGCIKGGDSETMCREFWNWLETFQAAPRRGTLVTFNGRGFDVPVLELAALRYGIHAAQHFNEQYGNRYRFQQDWHVDVLDLLTGYGAARYMRGGLSLLSVLAGMPAKGTSHSNLDDASIPLERVQRWCRNDVRRLYVVFQRLQFVRNRIKELPELPELEDEGA